MQSSERKGQVPKKVSRDDNSSQDASRPEGQEQKGLLWGEWRGGRGYNRNRPQQHFPYCNPLNPTSSHPMHWQGPADGCCQVLVMQPLASHGWPGDRQRLGSGAMQWA